MKFVVLHGITADSTGNWFPWLKSELESMGHEVWVPDLPDANRPNMEKYKDFLQNKGYDFNNSIIIGHSAGAVAIFGLLQSLPDDVKVFATIHVAAFTKELSKNPSWEVLSELFEKPFDFDAIKQKSGKFIFVNSKDDPVSPMEQAEELSQKLGGEMVVFDGMKHFSISSNPRFDKFPELLEIIKTKVL